VDNLFLQQGLAPFVCLRDIEGRPSPRRNIVPPASVGGLRNCVVDSSYQLASVDSPYQLASVDSSHQLASVDSSYQLGSVETVLATILSLDTVSSSIPNECETNQTTTSIQFSNQEDPELFSLLSSLCTGNITPAHSELAASFGSLEESELRLQEDLKKGYNKTSGSLSPSGSQDSWRPTSPQSFLAQQAAVIKSVALEDNYPQHVTPESSALEAGFNQPNYSGPTTASVVSPFHRASTAAAVQVFPDRLQNQLFKCPDCLKEFPRRCLLT
jgi:hypothetical protein